MPFSDAKSGPKLLSVSSRGGTKGSIRGQGERDKRPDVEFRTASVTGDVYRRTASGAILLERSGRSTPLPPPPVNGELQAGYSCLYVFDRNVAVFRYEESQHTWIHLDHTPVGIKRFQEEIKRYTAGVVGKSEGTADHFRLLEKTGGSRDSLWSR